MLRLPERPDGRCAPRESERGATAVEYALLVSFIAAVIAAIVLTLGTQVAALFDSVPPFI